ncbi:hypothetical protein H9Q74_013688 [Fusarium xylarioides]|nr:hypothetical protein H9Q71_013689 [Fusarium xylarioides]KAG5811159.1 hypothetical protein H9Q74_013688 [Fusarium xylarioides]
MSEVEKRDLDRDEEEEEEEEDEEEDRKEKIQDALKSIGQSFNRDMTEEDDAIGAFIDEYEEAIDSAGPHGTILHHIVRKVASRGKSDSFDPDHVAPLVNRLVRRDPSLLKSTNDEDTETPLYKAIRGKRYTWKLVMSILRICDEESKRDKDEAKPVRTALRDALEIPTGKGDTLKTCLAAAFDNCGTTGKSNMLFGLVSQASERILEICDGSGRSPFHLAVEYSQCADGRVPLIQVFSSKDMKVVERLRADSSEKPVETFMDIKYPKASGTEYSVYSEHERTKRIYLAKEAQKEETKLKEDQKHTEVKATSDTTSIRDKDTPKPSHREKGPKSNDDRDRGEKKQDKDRDPRSKADDAKSERQVKKEKERAELEKQEEQNRGDIQQDEAPYRKGAGLALGNGAGDVPRETMKANTKHQLLQPTNDEFIKSPLKRTQTKSVEAASVKKEKTKRYAAKSSAIDAKTLEKNSKKIQSMLKLHYMRSRSLKQVTSFLYGKNLQDIHITFDYYGLPTQITDHLFESLFGKDQETGIQFDDVLMYAKFKAVQVHRPGRLASKARSRGRQDMNFFSNWLRDKGVKRILKLQVEDDDQCPHSDETIQIVLDRFQIEHLDWQKTDLDARVICETGSEAGSETDDGSQGIRSDLTEVTLKWSGNNVALRGWSEPEGLPRLQNLEAVTIKIPALSDQHDRLFWIARNLQQFQDRLSKNISLFKKPNSRAVRVIESWSDKRAGTSASTNGATGTAKITNPEQENEWVNDMERFADPMSKLWEATLSKSGEKLKELEKDRKSLSATEMQILNNLQTLRKNVVVALIDDGVNTFDSFLSSRFIEGKTFDYRADGVGQYYISETGHGTDMARLILKVCPMASIYAIKLKTQRSSESGEITIEEDSAAAAIEAALEKKANIISMSWTIPEDVEDPRKKERLEEVLKRACQEQVLMFCSSPDKLSQNDTKFYPAKYDSRHFFLIGAADDGGERFNLTGKDNHFIFPGVNLTMSSDGRGSHSSTSTSLTRELTGSSVATALAAGLGAMMTYCFKTSALADVMDRIQQGNVLTASSTGLIRPEDVNTIAQHDGMKTVFHSIGPMKSSPPFIPVWRWFRPASVMLGDEKKTYEEKITQFKDLCRNLVQRQ